MEEKSSLNYKYKLVIFDMDGTILDTLDDLADSINHCLTTFGLPERTREEVRKAVGQGLHFAIEQCVPANCDKETIEKVYEEQLVYYRDHNAIKTAPYPGIKELLTKLKNDGVQLAVVSNKADFAVQSLCKHYFAGYFDFAIGERSGIRKKPYPDSVLEVVQLAGRKIEECVYVGDSEIDIATAVNANMDAVIVSYGFRDKEMLKENGAKVIVDKVDEIITKL